MIVPLMTNIKGHLQGQNVTGDQQAFPLGSFSLTSI